MNRYLFDFAISSLFIAKKKNLFIFFMLSTLVFLVASVVFIDTSLRYEVVNAAKSMPEIIVQKRIGQRLRDIDIDTVYKLIEIKGVQRALPRIWGLYRFQKGSVDFAVIALDGIDYDYTQELQKVSKLYGKRLAKGIVVGSGVKQFLEKNYYTKYCNFLLPDGKVKKLDIVGEFDSKSALFSNDVILMSAQNARELFGMKRNYASDIALFIPNPDEVRSIALKIPQIDPTLRAVTKTELISRYESMFDYKSGFFFVLFLLAAFTFFMIVSDRLASLSSAEKKEVAILKAIGWSIQDIVKEKFIESFIVASGAFFLGIVLSLVYVFVLGAPFMSEIFSGSFPLRPQLEFSYHVELREYLFIFLMSVPFYLFAVIVPAWRAAVKDVDEVLR